MKNKNGKSYRTIKGNYAFADLNENGSMRVTVSRKQGDGFDRDSFTISRETMKEICSALQPQSQNLPQRQTSESSASSYTLEQKREEQGGNAYRPWTSADEDYLKELFRGGCPIPQIAAELGRGEGAILSRLSKLGL